MAGATRPVGGGAYSSPRSEPGGQNTPRAGRVVASYGTYVSALGLFAQQVDQGSIFDDAADVNAIVAADGLGVEDYQFADTGSGTTTASGSGTESSTSTDAGSGIATASGTSTESFTASDSGSGITTANGTSAESYDTIDARSGTATASGSSVESSANADTSSGTVTASGIATESSAYIDSAAGSIIVSGIGVEDYATTDTRSGTVTASGTGSESYSFIDSQAGVVTADGTGVESYGFFYTDSASGTVTANGSSTEDRASTDSASGTLTTSGTGTEKLVYGDDATYYDNVIDVDNPVSHWKLGDPSTAIDRRGLLNLPAIGTIGGAITTEAALVANNGNDKANGFTGGNKSFDANPAIDRGLPYDTDTWSVEAWAKCSSYANSPYVVWRGITANQTLFAASTGRWVLQSKDAGGTTTQAFPAPSTLVLGQTYHVVGTYDGTNIILYINGVEAARAAMASQRHSTQFAPNISSDRSANGFEGTVDEVAWYPTALSAARVLAHYQAGTVDAGIVLPTVTASGSGAESSVNTDTDSGTVTASGSGTEVYSAPIVYTDSRTATITATGIGFQTYTPYDAVLDEDNPVSHWKLGAASIAVDRRQTQNLPAIGGPIGTVSGVVANNGNNQANVFTGVSNVQFAIGDAAGRGLPYEGVWSMEAWVTPTAIQEGKILARGLANFITLNKSGANLEVYLYGEAADGSQYVATYTLPSPVGQTFHIVGVHNGTALTLYVNGVQRGTSTVIGGGTRSYPNESPRIVGSWGTWPAAVVDEVAWYNTVLAPARVLAHYQAGVATDYDAVVDADAPVSHWKMGWSTTRAVDRARRKLNLDAQNPPIAISDKGVVYQGDNDRANTFVTGSSQRLSRSGGVGSDGSLYDTANLSVEAWIKPTATRLGFGDSPGIINRQFSEVVLQLFSAKPRFSFNDPAIVSKIASSPTSLVANAAYHLVGTYDGANLILYVNGAEMARLASATGIRSNPTNYPQIGYAGGDYWDGDIDEVAWYDTALSPARVQAHFLAGLPGYSTFSGSGVESYSTPVVYTDIGSGTVIASGAGLESNVITQALRPDADIAVAGWVVAPLYSKLSDSSDATVVTGVLV